jgi:hypothetical protein
MTLQFGLQSSRIWVLCEAMVKALFPIATICVLNQIHEHWLLPNALEFIISTCWDTQEELTFQTILNNFA